MSAGVMLIDGATGSELDRRGVDTSLPLWSARALIEAPDELARVHRDYLLAGADAITTNTFRTHRRSLAAAGLTDRWKDLTLLAVSIARIARDELQPTALVLGCVAPLEDCYSPQLAPPRPDCQREHAAMIGALIDGGVDLILIETMNNLAEARAAIDAARRISPGRWMVSFCTRGNEPGVLLSGESLEEFAADLSDASAIGINCVAAPVMRHHVAFLAAHRSGETAIAAYANIGQPDPVRGWVNTDATDPARYARYARDWVDAGATLVGGCCGTTPETIRVLHHEVRSP